MMNCVSVLILVVLLQSSRVKGQLNITAGPQNVTVIEGGDTKMLCQTNIYSIPQWRISGITYTLFSLPPLYVVMDNSLLIHNVPLNLNGTSFQCIIKTGSKTILSSIGILTVINYETTLLPSKEISTNFMSTGILLKTLFSSVSSSKLPSAYMKISSRIAVGSSTSSKTPSVHQVPSQNNGFQSSKMPSVYQVPSQNNGFQRSITNSVYQVPTQNNTSYTSNRVVIGTTCFGIVSFVAVSVIIILVITLKRSCRRPKSSLECSQNEAYGVTLCQNQNPGVCQNLCEESSKDHIYDYPMTALNTLAKNNTTMNISYNTVYGVLERNCQPNESDEKQDCTSDDSQLSISNKLKCDNVTNIFENPAYGPIQLLVMTDSKVPVKP